MNEDAIYEWITYMLEELILSDPMLLTLENYLDLLSYQIELMYEIQFDNSIDEDIYDVAVDYYFTIMMPPRSYIKLRKSGNIAVKTSHINYLRDIPQPDQRTPEWYLCRYNMITASSAWKALDSEKIKNSYIYEKCSPLKTDRGSHCWLGFPQLLQRHQLLLLAFLDCKNPKRLVGSSNQVRCWFFQSN